MTVTVKYRFDIVSAAAEFQIATASYLITAAGCHYAARVAIPIAAGRDNGGQSTDTGCAVGSSDPSLSECARTSESSEMVAERFSGGWEWERKRKRICAFVAAFRSRWEYALEAQFWDS
jgi:hypothetical protein